MASEMVVYCPKPRSSTGQPCHTPMEKVNDRGVIVDKCPRDGSTFLDPGEMERIIAQVSVMPGYNPQQVLHAQPHHYVSSDNHHGYAPAGHHYGSSGQRRGHHRGSGGLFGGLFD